MTQTRSLGNASKIVDWTPEINEVGNQYGFFNRMGACNSRGTSQTAIVFDKIENTVTLLPQTSRKERNKTYGKDRKIDTFSLALPYFKHGDYLTNEDVQGWRRPAEPDEADSIARATQAKIEDMRLAADQTQEYMKIQAMKGITKSPEGTVIANMFTEFGVTQDEVFFDLSNASANITENIHEVRRLLRKNAKAAGVIGKPMFMVGNSFFDKFVTHPDVEEAYRDYVNVGAQRLRDDLQREQDSGMVGVFEHRGIMLVNYDAEFNLPDGTSEKAYADTEGYTYMNEFKDLYRGFNGPSNKLSGANQVGQEMFLFEYPDPKDEFHECELEMANLYFMTKPLMSVKLDEAAS